LCFLLKGAFTPCLTLAEGMRALCLCWQGRRERVALTGCPQLAAGSGRLAKPGRDTVHLD